MMWRRRRWHRRRRRYVYHFDIPNISEKDVHLSQICKYKINTLYFLTFQIINFENCLKKRQKWLVFWNELFNAFRRSYFWYTYRLNFSSDVFWLLNFIKDGSMCMWIHAKKFSKPSCENWWIITTPQKYHWRILIRYGNV